MSTVIVIVQSYLGDVNYHRNRECNKGSWGGKGTQCGTDSMRGDIRKTGGLLTWGNRGRQPEGKRGNGLKKGKDKYFLFK